MHALDKAAINLSANKLIASLEERLSQMKIAPDQSQPGQ